MKQNNTRVKIELAASAIAFLLCFSSRPSVAAETVHFHYGIAGQSVSVEDLEAFARTGEQSPAIAFLLRYMGRDPELVRLLLRQQIPIDAVTASKLLDSPIGEYILERASTVVHTGATRGNTEALRGALIGSADGDGQISLLEVWQNYPTRKVKVDGKSWNRMTSGFVDALSQVGKTAELSMVLVRNFFAGR